MSVGELAMTLSISLVAVCCSNDSLSSWNSRAFSIAITAFWKFSVGGSKVMDMYRLPVNDCSTSGCVTIQDADGLAHSTCHGNGAEVRNKTQKVTIKAKDRSIFGVTEYGSSLGNPIEHRLKVSWRARDHPQDVAGRRLSLEQPVALELEFLVLPNQLCISFFWRGSLRF